ncbi:cupin domain-containing protein [Amycolatopsis pithecellobii]|uniref:Cupin domain-containing protein n=1 Tax=Amycolatopsis pithecellobii TaxID=664692 RepID=A0A6N7Z3L9_9PSEU|nr:cupin domain-containing protein [Amycolatopsis pithecellobii]MTD56553.1 cupin domain-containing protein [Amycolatopsis pithecellobii]
MEFVREFVPSKLAEDRFDYTVLADMESCLIVGCRAPGVVSGFPRHRHHADQLYYVLKGRMDLELNGEHHDVAADSVVFIPEGTPHSNSYPDAAEEWHLDLIVPAPSTMGTVAVDVDADVTGGPGTGFVRAVGDVVGDEVLPGFRSFVLADRTVGSRHISLRMNEVDAGSEKLPWHIHDFDQFYFVLDGVLELEVGRKRYSVPPMNLVVLPAGVPHRNWNEGSVTERHLALLTPHPVAGEPPDYGVNFELTGNNF